MAIKNYATIHFQAHLNYKISVIINKLCLNKRKVFCGILAVASDFVRGLIMWQTSEKHILKIAVMIFLIN